MIKTILVPSSGSQADERVFATALSMAKPLAAHLQFLHLRIEASEAVRRVPHAEYCHGRAIGAVLEEVHERTDQLAQQAHAHFESFCASRGLTLGDFPAEFQGVTASWSQHTHDAGMSLISQARHHDITVVARRHHEDLMPADLIERLLIGSGRPVLIAADAPGRSFGEHAVVAWKERPESARALAAALPILRHAREVTLLSVLEEGCASLAALEDVTRLLLWHGIRATARILDLECSAIEALPSAAQRIGADLLVTGGFGHRPLRELVFGGVTQRLLEHADVPVLMMH